MKNWKEEILKRIHSASNMEDLDKIRIDVLGKNGALTSAMKTLSALEPEERSQQGATLNVIKQEILESMTSKKIEIEGHALNQQLERERLDITLPSRPENKGSIHPISQAMEELMALFLQMGFSVEEGSDIEDDFHNFTALNIPTDHPARQEHDTFYVQGKLNGTPGVLRTHTSPVQIRTMTNQKPPIRMVTLGRVFRADYDMTHTPMFHQIEGLVIDCNIHMGHLKHTVLQFMRSFFNLSELKLRFRPSFFPFTEPSAEVDIQCDRSDGSIKLGKGNSWLEMGGCGMVHPQVLKNCGIDPDKYQGFAFGCGIERLAMLKYGVGDLREFFDSDIRWLNYYGSNGLDIPSSLYTDGKNK